MKVRMICSSINFYPRSPCGERLISTKKGQVLSLFLSTLSLRRATLDVTIIGRTWDISIHALLAESDPPVREIIQWEGIFLSTLSLRRATNSAYGALDGASISIHALLAESDVC